jgi:hypothetical protein
MLVYDPLLYLPLELSDNVPETLEVILLTFAVLHHHLSLPRQLLYPLLLL